MKVILAVFFLSAMGLADDKIPSAVHQVLQKARNKAAAANSSTSLQAGLHEPLGKYLLRQGRTLHLLRSPISVENLKTDSEFPAELEFLQRISKAGSVLFDPLENTIQERLNFLAEKLEAGEPMSDSLLKEYEAALTLLYTDRATRKPSPKYQALLEYEAKRKKLVEAYKNAETEQARQIINLELQRLDQDRLLFSAGGHEIEKAVFTVERVERDQKLADLDLVRASLRQGGLASYKQLQDSVRSKSGWVIFGAPVNANGGVKIEGRAIESRVVRVQGNLVGSRVEYPGLQYSSFARQGNWKSGDWSLSDGDASQDGPKELVPRLNTELILADKWELTFDDAATVSRIQSALREGKSVQVNGLTLTADKVDFPKPSSVRVNVAHVLGVYDEALPKIPR